MWVRIVWHHMTQDIYFYPSVWPFINSYIDRHSTLPRHVFCFDDVDILNTDHLTQTQVWLARVNYCAEGLFVNVVKRWSLRKVMKSWPPSFLKLDHFEHDLFVIIGPKIWRIKTARVRFHLTVPVTMAGVDLQISYQDLKLSCARRRKLQVKSM